MIAFISKYQQGQPGVGSPLFSQSIFIVSEDGSNPTYFEREDRLPGLISYPAWSHDSNYLAYVLHIPENGIGIIDINSGDISRLNSETIPEIPEGTDETHGILPLKSIAWLPGDRLILFLTNGESAEKDILWAVETNGTNPIRLYEDNIQEIALSPDGRELAFIVENRDGFSIKILEINEMVTVNTLLDTTEWNLVNYPDAQFRDLEWSPDGSSLIFAANPVGNFDLFLWNFNAQELLQVSETAGIDEIAPHWRPNGRFP
jgi:Tol biopolymer transport system component